MQLFRIYGLCFMHCCCASKMFWLFALVLSAVCLQCPVWHFFWLGFLLSRSVRSFRKILRWLQLSLFYRHHFCFHIPQHWLSIVGSFLITFLSSDILIPINIHIHYYYYYYCGGCSSSSISSSIVIGYILLLTSKLVQFLTRFSCLQYTVCTLIQRRTTEVPNEVVCDRFTQ